MVALPVREDDGSERCHSPTRGRLRRPPADSSSVFSASLVLREKGRQGQEGSSPQSAAHAAVGAYHPSRPCPALSLLKLSDRSLSSLVAPGHLQGPRAPTGSLSPTRRRPLRGRAAPSWPPPWGLKLLWSGRVRGGHRMGKRGGAALLRRASTRVITPNAEA